MVVANMVAALGFLAAWPWATGQRGMLFFIAGIVHAVLAAGLWRMKNWARILMIGGALFQFTGLLTGVIIRAALVQAGDLVPDATLFFLLAAVSLPLLLWAPIYLLRPAGEALFTGR